jgi:hypothetical protein
MLMPLSDAQALRERLIDYAADTKDHTRSCSSCGAQIGLIDDVYPSHTGYRCWNRERV